jgi:phage gpG-like protein
MAKADSGKQLLKYSLENYQTFQSKIDEAFKKVGNLRVPFSDIVDDFYKSERAIFKLKSPGAYKDLTPAYAKRKEKKHKFKYPILRATGKLERSVTERGGPGNITIIGDRFAVVGTFIPYAAVHQFGGGNNIPSRPFIFVGPETSRFEEADRQGLGGRLTRWTNMLDGYVQAVMDAAVK